MLVRPAHYDLPVVQGEDLNVQLLLRHPQLDIDGKVVRDVNGAVVYQVIDTTDWQGHMQIRRKIRGEVVVDLTLDPMGDDGYVLVDAAGIVTVKIRADQTWLLKSGFPYDLFAGPIGSLVKWIGGVVRLESGVTR